MDKWDDREKDYDKRYDNHYDLDYLDLKINEMQKQLDNMQNLLMKMTQINAQMVIEFSKLYESLNNK